jgi:hypothetical protein
MKKRTQLISLLAGFAALTAATSVPAFGETRTNFVLVSNRGSAGHDVSIAEYPNIPGRPAQKAGTWSVGGKNAHYWIIDPGDWVEVTGPNNFDEKIAATDLPVCYRITDDQIMHRVTDSCTTDGASETSW